MKIGRPHRTRWQDRAERLARAIPKARLQPEALAWSEARPRREAWAVAFSGGADSLALLLLAWAHWPERRGRLRALHFDHRLRGAASRGDARFCAAVCRGLGVPLALGRWRRPPPAASEAVARAARLDFFARTMAARGARSLWLGQQQDDVAETMLMRLARGSGTGGLAAPRPVQARPGGLWHLRPLLDLKKAEIVSALRAEKIPWRDDASNATDTYFRNRIRRAVLPAWTRAAGRDAVAGAALSRTLLAEDDAALEAWVDELDAVTPGGRLDLARVAGRPSAVLRRTLHRWLRVQPQAGELSRQGFATLLAAVRLGRPARHSLGAEGFAVIRGKWLRFAKT